jgi:NADP-dependent 3-hydroxy acid dehydrogenase YdfG
MKQKLIIITGASSGIGKACAKAFSKAGYHLLLLARRLEPMQALGLPNAICKSVDVTDVKAVQAVIDGVDLDRYDIDCLINNAGSVVGGHYSETDGEAENAMVDLNIKGVMNCTKAAAPLMQKNKQGTIVNMSSIGDRMFGSGVSAIYCATKAAIKSFTQSLHLTYKDDNIRCCNVAPGYIDTPIWANIKKPSYEGTGMALIPAEKFAQMVLWIYQQPQDICVRDIVITPTQSPF